MFTARTVSVMNGSVKMCMEASVVTMAFAPAAAVSVVMDGLGSTASSPAAAT